VKEEAMTSEKTLEMQLLECEQQFWQALTDGDVEAAKNLTDFPCIITGAQGVGKVDARSFEAMMKNPSYVLHRFELADGAEVRALSDDVAVVAYRVHEELTVDGKPISLDAADSSTWVRRDGKWRCALHTEAIAGDPFGRDRAV
jgi:hypothetical protein